MEVIVLRLKKKLKQIWNGGACMRGLCLTEWLYLWQIHGAYVHPSHMTPICRVYKIRNIYNFNYWRWYGCISCSLFSAIPHPIFYVPPPPIGYIFWVHVFNTILKINLTSTFYNSLRGPRTKCLSNAF